jgi:uncharacterized protein YmfQ (DUF2313 family)
MDLIARYVAQLKALLPRGALWRALARGPVFNSLLTAIADGLARLHLRIEQLVVEGDPRTTTELLPEWEATVGLPDGCLPELGGTLGQRRAIVVSRLRAVGGNTDVYLEAEAAALGFEIDVVNAGPSDLDIHVDGIGVIRMTCNDTCSDSLGQFVDDDSTLRCLLDRIKPAHCTYELVYSET